MLIPWKESYNKPRQHSKKQRHHFANKGLYSQSYGFSSIIYWCESEVAPSCLILCDPMDCSLPGFSIHGIFQARILECVVISFSRRSSLPRVWTQVSCIVGRLFTIWANKSTDVRALPKRRLSAEELMLSNCAGEDSWESLGLQGDQTSQSWRKSILNIHWKDWCWSWSSNTLATLCEELTHWKRPWCWARLKTKGEGSERGWDG